MKLLILPALIRSPRSATVLAPRSLSRCSSSDTGRSASLRSGDCVQRYRRGRTIAHRRRRHNSASCSPGAPAGEIARRHGAGTPGKPETGTRADHQARHHQRSGRPPADRRACTGYRLVAPGRLFRVAGVSPGNRSISASLIGPSGSSTFRLSINAVSMSLAGSCFSSESAPGPFHHGIRGRGGTIC